MFSVAEPALRVAGAAGALGQAVDLRDEIVERELPRDGAVASACSESATSKVLSASPSSNLMGARNVA
jgi:hypothetical protein